VAAADATTFEEICINQAANTGPLKRTGYRDLPKMRRLPEIPGVRLFRSGRDFARGALGRTAEAGVPEKTAGGSSSPSSRTYRLPKPRRGPAGRQSDRGAVIVAFGC